MNAIEMLLDILTDISKRHESVLTEIAPSRLRRQPSSGANSIGVAVRHVTRVFDVFLTQHFEKQPTGSERWHMNGWAIRYGYDPHGIGTPGWGVLTGYTTQGVADIPHLDGPALLSYFNEVSGDLAAFVAEWSAEKPQEKAPGFKVRQSYCSWLRTSILAAVRRVGETRALRALNERLPA